MKTAKTRQLLKVEACGKTFTVVFYNDGRSNPYCIYRTTYVPGDYGYRQRKSIEAKYADMRSCMFWLARQF